ncbi:kinase-like domain-containing protein [Suillus clintonianus]|uniref:kinase-like domain-containing protein n=1 Tax=Suillus clintonianus TaxID=1904413 RepID=UPI001B860785|nr:kinase-like domain-containing protein [Suillus clintonianus]KAG2119357.1 kinase-like domain-containing protein [Suillus clintonianus]
MSTHSESQRLVAVKSIRVPPLWDRETVQAKARDICRQAYIWIQLKHDHILPFEGVTEGFGPLPSLVSPWMKEGSLNDYLQREFSTLLAPQKRELIQQVASGLDYLHGRGIVHGDLTPYNILVDSSGSLCISDFGLSIFLAEAKADMFNSHHVGSARWMPPEALNDEYSPTQFWDIYSYGCVVLQIFSGKQPYHDIRNVAAVVSAIVNGREPFDAMRSYGEYGQLSMLCFSKIPAERPTTGEIMRLLKDLPDAGPNTSATRHPVQQLEDVCSTPPAVVDDSRDHFDVQPPAEQLEDIRPTPPVVVDDSRDRPDLQPPAEQLEDVRPTPPVIVDDSQDYRIGHAISAPSFALRRFLSLFLPSQPDADVAHPWRRFFSRRAPSARTVGDPTSLVFVARPWTSPPTVEKSPTRAVTPLLQSSHPQAAVTTATSSTLPPPPPHSVPLSITTAPADTPVPERAGCCTRFWCCIRRCICCSVCRRPKGSSDDRS